MSWDTELGNQLSNCVINEMDISILIMLKYIKKGSKNEHKVQENELLVVMIMLCDNRMKVSKEENVLLGELRCR